MYCINYFNNSFKRNLRLKEESHYFVNNHPFVFHKAFKQISPYLSLKVNILFYTSALST